MQPTPLIAIANYLFDSLPQDLFGVENGQLHEIGVTLQAKTPPPPGRRFPPLSELDIQYVYTPASFPYYADAEMDEVLQRYVELADEVIRFPVGALECCRQLRLLSGDDLLLLSADLGLVHAEALCSVEVAPLFYIHDGTFSMPVNFHAIGEYLCDRQGVVMRPPPLHRSLCVVGFVTRPDAQCRATQAAFAQHVALFGPDDASTLIYWLTTQTETLPLEVVVALLRFSHHDPMVLKRVLKHFEAFKDKLTGAEIDLLAGEIKLVWGNYYFQTDRYNLPFELGVFFMNLQRPALAVEYFVQAEHYYGATLETIYNLAVCYHQKGQLTEALACLARAQTISMDGPPLIQTHYRRRLASLRAAILGEPT